MSKEITGRAALGLSFCIMCGLALLVSPAYAKEPLDLFAVPASGSDQVVDHAVWDELLQTYVSAGPGGVNRVDYARFKTDGHDALKGYVRQLEAIDPQALDRPEQFALLANLYNAKTIDIILDHYPLKSIKDISLGGGLLSVFTGGPWKAKVTRLGGTDLSLDDIEHGILRPIFNDPRIHYAVNCASVGCPNLRREAFTGAKLNAQLDAAARDYVNHPRGAKVEADGLVVSSIYKWYGEDFGGSEEGVVDHLRQFADPDLAAKLRGVTSIASYDYDWTLNDTKR